MRTTLTLDEDVAEKLKSEARRSARSLRETVNDTLRRGLAMRPQTKRASSFRVVARDLGNLRPGLSLDSVADLTEQSEGPLHR